MNGTRGTTKQSSHPLLGNVHKKEVSYRRSKPSNTEIISKIWRSGQKELVTDMVCGDAMNAGQAQ